MYILESFWNPVEHHRRVKNVVVQGKVGNRYDIDLLIKLGLEGC